MLVLTRRCGEEIVIGGNIHVTVLSVQGDKVRIGITAPRSVAVDRQEVYERRLMAVGECDEPSIATIRRQDSKNVLETSGA